MSSIIPPFKGADKRIMEMNFSDVVLAGATLCLCAGPVPFPFALSLVKMIFTDDANNWIKLNWYVCDSYQPRTTTSPSGTNPFSQAGAGGGFYGVAIERVAYSNMKFPEPGKYIALLIESVSPYDYRMNASAIATEVEP